MCVDGWVPCCGICTWHARMHAHLPPPSMSTLLGLRSRCMMGGRHASSAHMPWATWPGRERAGGRGEGRTSRQRGGWLVAVVQQWGHSGQEVGGGVWGRAKTSSAARQQVRGRWYEGGGGGGRATQNVEMSTHSHCPPTRTSVKAKLRCSGRHTQLELEPADRVVIWPVGRSVERLAVFPRNLPLAPPAGGPGRGAGC